MGSQWISVLNNPWIFNCGTYGIVKVTENVRPKPLNWNRPILLGQNTIWVLCIVSKNFQSLPVNRKLNHQQSLYNVLIDRDTSKTPINLLIKIFGFG